MGIFIWVLVPLEARGTESTYEWNNYFLNQKKEKHIPIGSFGSLIKWPQSTICSLPVKVWKLRQKSTRTQSTQLGDFAQSKHPDRTPPNQEMSNIPEAPLGPSQPHPTLSPKAATVIFILWPPYFYISDGPDNYL